MFVNNKKTGSRGVEYRDGSTRTVLKVFMPFIPRTDEYYDKYAVFDKNGKIVEIRTKAQDVMEEHMKWHNELFKDEKQ
tara:strand:+ start:5162 stop:5395 length:234 start_codon:yes stop_codon:yes gene_type:complete